MANANSKGSGSATSPQAENGNTTQTIEEIERRAADVLEQERQALRALVDCLREIAVRLPVESRLPLDLAKAAGTLELWAELPMTSSMHSGVRTALGWCSPLERA